MPQTFICHRCNREKAMSQREHREVKAGSSKAIAWTDSAVPVWVAHRQMADVCQECADQIDHEAKQHILRAILAVVIGLAIAAILILVMAWRMGFFNTAPIRPNLKKQAVIEANSLQVASR